MRRWHILARHPWVAGATITETYREDRDERRFVATICGFRNWRLFEGVPTQDALSTIIAITTQIRDLIRENGYDSAVFSLLGEFPTTQAELEAILDTLNRLREQQP